MKFKIGDKVTPIPERIALTAANIGDVHEVTGCTEWDSPEISGYGSINEDNWQLWTEPKVETKVFYIKTDNAISVHYNGKHTNIISDDKRFAPLCSALKNEMYDTAIGIIEENERAFSGKGLALVDGVLNVKGTPMPTELSARILAFKESGDKFDYLLKFWDNLQSNPSFNSRQMLFKFLEHNGHPITPDGCFIAYRGVTSDFKDKHTRKWDNAVGSVCEIDRSEVDDNPNNTCSFGLHVACWNYAQSWGDRVVMVKVNPADVVAVPTDYNGTKMRVCRFEVMEECTKEIHADVQVYGDDEECDYEGHEDCDEDCDDCWDC